MSESVTVHLPLRTVSRLNVREHWAARAKRSRKEREAGMLSLAGWPHRVQVHDWLKVGAVCVEMVRIGPKALDVDNLGGALKSLQDGLADALGVDDADPRVAWVRKQEAGKQHGVRIVVSPIRMGSGV